MLPSRSREAFQDKRIQSSFHGDSVFQLCVPPVLPRLQLQLHVLSEHAFLTLSSAGYLRLEQTSSHTTSIG